MKKFLIKKQSQYRNLNLTMFESAITEGLLAMSIMTLFYTSALGMNQAEIALSQAIFTIVVMLLNLPLGWVADRFSRKWANIIGDFGVAVGFLLYSQVQSFAGVVACECWLGVFMAFSQGVDQSLLRHFANKIDPSGKLFRRKTINLASWRYVLTLGLVLLGGPIGAISFRLAIALSGVPSLIGGIASIFIQDDSVRLQSQYQNPFADMGRISRETWQNHPLRRRILAFMVGREMTHGIIWVFTPMLIYVGVPVAVVSFAWAFNSLANLLGSRLAAKFALRLKDWQIFAVPITLMIASMTILSFQLNLGTVILYALMGVAQGWTGSTLMPMVQNKTRADEQTTVISLAKVGSQLLYIPAVWLIGLAADFQLNFAPLMTLVIFAPLGLSLLVSLYREIAQAERTVC